LNEQERERIFKACKKLRENISISQTFAQIELIETIVSRRRKDAKS